MEELGALPEPELRYGATPAAVGRGSSLRACGGAGAWGRERTKERKGVWGWKDRKVERWRECAGMDG